MMMVLPAPVSPDSTLRPGPNSSATWSMIAKLRILSSSSIACPHLPAAANYSPSGSKASSPSQLVAPDLEVAVRGAHQRDRNLALADSHPILRAQGNPLLAVGGQHRVVIGGLDMDLQRAGVGQHHRAIAQRMRTDRRQHHDFEGGKNDRA